MQRIATCAATTLHRFMQLLWKKIFTSEPNSQGSREPREGALHCMARIAPKEPDDSALSVFASGQMRTHITWMRTHTTGMRRVTREI